MKIGIVLPQFTGTPDAAVAVARAAESSGLDGIFATDHLWSPVTGSGTALAPIPLLSALAATTRSIALGTLVLRVGITPDLYVERQFDTLRSLAGPRVIAGLGIGDARSRPENVAYGIDWPSRERRLERLGACCAALRARAHVVWVGGRSDAVRALAHEHGVVCNVWCEDPDDARGIGDTWGGPVDMTVPSMVTKLRAARDNEMQWAVVLVRGSGREPERAVETLGRAIGQLV